MTNFMTTTDYRPLSWVAAMALFMQSLDATILNTALPAIAADLHEPAFEMQMVIISYSLAVALFMPLTAWISARYGARSIFQTAVFLFILGSIACAVATSLNILVWTRVLQGCGGAFMMPVARLAIIQIVPKHQLLYAWNLMATAGLIGPILGPILGGWFVSHISWHWIFLINIPIGIAGIFAARLVIPNIRGEIHKLDWSGYLLFASGLVGSTLGLDLLSETTQNNLITYLILVAGFLLMGAYYQFAKNNENAILPLSLFQVRTFKLGMIANACIRLSASGIPFLLPLMFQLAFGYSAEMSGWLLAPIAVTSVVFKTFVVRILARFNYKTTLIVVSICMGLSIVSMAFLRADTPMWQIVLNLVCYGACMSIIFSAINTLTVGDLSSQQAGAGSTMLSIMQQVGIGFGIAVSSILLAIFRYFYGDTGERLQLAFSYTFIASSLFALLLVWTLSFLNKTDGDHLRHKV